MLLACISQQGREIQETFTFDSDDDEMKLEPVLNKFSDYCNPRKNVIILRHKFFMWRQLKSQIFRYFIIKLSVNLKIFETKEMIVCGANIVGKGVILEIQDVLTFRRSMGKAKVLNNSCNQYVYNFYPQSILILEEYLRKW